MDVTSPALLLELIKIGYTFSPNIDIKIFFQIIIYYIYIFLDFVILIVICIFMLYFYLCRD